MDSESEEVYQEHESAIKKWAAKQTVKAITKAAVKALLIGLGVAAGPAGIAAGGIALYLTSSKPAY